MSVYRRVSAGRRGGGITGFSRIFFPSTHGLTADGWSEGGLYRDGPGYITHQLRANLAGRGR